MDNNKITKMDEFFRFLKEGQKGWERKSKIDYKLIKKKKMNSMQKYRMDNEDFKDIRKPKEIQDPKKLWGFIVYEGTKFFNGDILNEDELNININEWIAKEWIWVLRHPNLGISDCKKIQKYLNLEIIKIDHNAVHVDEEPQGALFGSVMIHFKITCTNIVYWDMIKKYFDNE